MVYMSKKVSLCREGITRCFEKCVVQENTLNTAFNGAQKKKEICPINHRSGQQKTLCENF